MKCISLLLLIFVFAWVAIAQIATGGDFTLEKSVVAGGGGASSGGVFQVGSTTGQAIAGGPKTGGVFSLNSGFWVPDSVPTPTGTCPFGQGHWKNNPDMWPVNSLILGNEMYTKTELLIILNTPAGSGKKTDASLILAYQLIAAKLNAAAGIDAGPLGTAISDADNVLGTYNGKLPYKIAASTAGGQNMVSLASHLESYNAGMLTLGCTPLM